ncbi:MAG: ATP-dependent RecD-like DNA helicase [Desulfovibrio sp.]|nr:ATP-dependent RecD-like DNA helicase [Desulfovibrio sp.]
MQTNALERLRGQIERVTYTSEETGYSVLRVKVSGRQELVTVVGSIANPQAGEILQMSGEWSSHPKFGEQFKVAFYQVAVPATAVGIEKYLGSGLIKGIGPKMAKRIVKTFGEQTLEIIEQKPEKLAEVEGIGKHRIALIAQAWEDQKEIRQVMIFLQSQGVSSAYAARIFKHYGKQAIATVTENPYRLAYDIYGIGFLTADKIAAKLGFAKDSPLRAEAGLLYVLHTMMEEGHVFYPMEPLLKNAMELLGIAEKKLLVQACERLTWDQRLRIEQLALPEPTAAVYLAGYHLAEGQVAERVAKLLRTKALLRKVDCPKALAWAEEKTRLSLAAKQREAVLACLTQKMVIITGGPGTGKSTILHVILTIYGAISQRILLAAPTGRAAKRMTEVTGIEAKTIHRLLSYDFKKCGFKKNEEDPLDCDLLVLDEVSMVDLLLFYHLLKALPQNAKFIVVGDTNQLPSVGAGAVLHDLIQSGVVPVVCLTEIFRQSKQSSIISNAHKIIHGQNLFFPNSEKDDMFFMEESDPEKVLETIVGLVKTRLPRKYGWHPVNQIQVLTPMNRGAMGTQRLNEALQEALNPHGQAITRGGRVFRLGDKVMQIRNNYDKEVFNGDIGCISRVDPENQEVVITIDEREVPYEYQDLDEIVLAYAISIHKSQGAEYPVVVMPICTQHYVMLQRNLLYTGVTRGKKLVVLIGTRKALGIAIRNTTQTRRYTALDWRLKQAWAQLA